MPNAINRCKPNPLVKVEKENENQDIRRKVVKVEKENENQDIRRKSKTPTKEKQVEVRQETVWERLSKVKRCTSNEENLGNPTKSRLALRAKSAQRISNLRNSAITNVRKPLSPNSNSNKRNSDKRTLKKKRSPPDTNKIIHNYQPPVVPDIPIPLCTVDKSMNEILTVRSISNSKSSSDDSKYVDTQSSNSSRNKHTSFCETSLKTSPKSSSDESKYVETVSSSSIRPKTTSYATSLLDSPTSNGSNSVHEIKKAIKLTQSSNVSYNSAGEYEMAPLMPSSTRASLNSSLELQSNFESLLRQRQRSMNSEELKLIRNVLKTDERHRQLRKSDEQLFKDILKSQLREILRQGTAVKSALHMLDTSESESMVVQPSRNVFVEKSVAFRTEKPDKQQVDVVFKNVPTLEKEIIILRALGEKLEATLQRTVSRKSLTISEGKTTATSTMRFKRMQLVHCVMALEHNATIRVRTKGVRCHWSLVKEFHIAYKTIVELKEEADRHFYLPFNDQLKRTSFKKLKRNPDELMRHLRPKNSMVPFNVLEQDPVFFNNFLYNMKSSSWPRSICDSPVFSSSPEGGCSEDSYQIVYNHQSGDAPTPVFNEIEVNAIGDGETSNVIRQKVSFSDHIEIENALHEQTDEAKNVKEKLKEEPILKKVVRRRKRRTITPMPMERYLEPKNNLLKTILVGTLQISVFIILIMAITYPEVKC